MATPFLSEIKIAGFNFPPKGWATCNGQLLAINQNLALFSLLGTQYGGNGSTNFGLPNLQGRVPIHVGTGYSQGQSGGTESVTLTPPELAPHTHGAMGTSDNGDAPIPTNTVLGSVAETYTPAANLKALMATTLGPSGQAQPHNNLQPFLVLTMVIALVGVFPSRN